MLQITDIKNRVIFEVGIGGKTKYWVSDVVVEGSMLVFNIPYAEDWNGAEWKHSPDAHISLSEELSTIRRNSMTDHPTQPSACEYVIHTRYAGELNVLKEGMCMSDVVLHPVK